MKFQNHLKNIKTVKKKLAVIEKISSIFVNIYLVILVLYWAVCRCDYGEKKNPFCVLLSYIIAYRFTGAKPTGASKRLKH